MTEQGSQQVPIGEAMRLAAEHHQAGRLPEAEAIYRAVLESEPEHVGAIYNLALIALQRGNPKEAVPVMRAATEREPGNASHWMNYAVALAGSGQPQAARDVLLRARERKLGGQALDGVLVQVERMLRNAASPTVVETVGEKNADAVRSPNLPGLLQLYDQGQYAQVELEAREFWPGAAHSATLARLLGGALLAQGKFEQAREVLVVASGMHGGDALIHRMLGMTLRRSGRNDEARAAFERSLDLAPDDVDTLLHAAVNALALRDPLAARDYADRALSLKPDSVGGLWVLADATAEGGRHDEAVGLYQRAIALDPNIAALHINLGHSLTRLGRPTEAVVALEQALSLSPNDAQGHLNLGRALFRLGETAAASGHFRQASDIAPDRTEAHDVYLFCLLHDDTVSAKECLAEHRRLGSLIEAPFVQLQRPHQNDRDADRGLRVGFVSADLREHAVAYQVEPLWQAMRGGRHRVIAYSNSAMEDAASARLRALADEWARVDQLGDEALAERVRRDRIDVLVDLSGHTTANRLPVFAMKPAPVQASMIGYPGTTGLASIDYLILYVANESSQELGEYVCERLVRLRARGFQPEWTAPAVGPLPALSAGHVTFGSFNRPAKIGASTVALWSGVLHAVPGSKLLIAVAGEARTQERLRAQFLAEGIAAERLIFRASVPHAQFLGLFNEVDIALDTMPYTGSTTTSQALWMGVPLLTLAGPTPQQDQSTTILGHAGMTDWIARSPGEFVARASAAAADLHALDHLRQTLRPRVAGQFDGDVAQLGQAMDTALQTMWRRWCAGLPPESFTVSA